MHRAGRTLIALVALVLVGCSSSEMGVPNVHTVVPGTLVRGGQPDAEGFAALKARYAIRTVVNLNDDTAVSERALVTALGMEYVPLPSDAFAPDRGRIVEFLRVMSDPAGRGPVFVHCQHGMDRTGLAVAAYRIVLEGWTAEQALRELRSRQHFLHTLVLTGYPSFVRSIEQDRAWWLAQLASRPAPVAAGDDANDANDANDEPPDASERPPGGHER